MDSPPPLPAAALPTTRYRIGHAMGCLVRGIRRLGPHWALALIVGATAVYFVRRDMENRSLDERLVQRDIRERTETLLRWWLPSGQAGLNECSRLLGTETDPHERQAIEGAMRRLEQQMRLR